MKLLNIILSELRTFKNIIKPPRVMGGFSTCIFILCLISSLAFGIDSLPLYINRCATDQHCPKGYYCYQTTNYCAECLECSKYLRQSSWRACPKVPHDCGACMEGYQEDILAGGKTREICVPSVNYSLSQTNPPVTELNYERYVWVVVAMFALIPLGYYVFCKAKDRRTIHVSLPSDEPPPYRSMELNPFPGNNADDQPHSEEVVVAENHEVNVRQQKDFLTQAQPFCRPNYESGFCAVDGVQEPDQNDIVDLVEEQASPGFDVIDENTMPSDWAPGVEQENNGQLLNFEIAESDAASDEETACEPASKRPKVQNSSDEDESHNPNRQYCINFIINNTVTINKESSS